DDVEFDYQDIEYSYQGNGEEIRIESLEELKELKKLSGLQSLENLHIDIDLDEEDSDKDFIFRFRGSGDKDNNSFRFNWDEKEDLPDEVKEKLRDLDIKLQDKNGIIWIEQDEDDRRSFRSSDKPFLGVVMSDHRYISQNGNDQAEKITGVKITRVVSNSAAEAAGLRKGDIITALNGQNIDSYEDVSRTMRSMKVGEQLEVGYLRDEQPATTTATLKAKKRRSHRVYNYRGYSSSNKAERPCVFIGVEVQTGYSSSNREGVRVQRVLDDTPAAESDLQRGDAITAINGVEINSFNELLAERNKYNPGDEVEINFLHNGELKTNLITFRKCGEEEEVVQEDVTPVVEELPLFPERINSNLELSNFTAFPNPSTNLVNIRFQADAAPTVIKMLDIDGRELYVENLPNFDGNYDNQIDLTSAPNGTLILTISQNNQVYTDKIIKGTRDGLRP
ncbi:MAG: PDZ domain-containing protein, partial [Bacteroidota bacterium]